MRRPPSSRVLVFWIFLGLQLLLPLSEHYIRRICVFGEQICRESGGCEPSPFSCDGPGLWSQVLGGDCESWVL